MSDEVPRSASEATCEAARRQAVHRVWLDWALSTDRESWLPVVLNVSVVQDVADLFVRNRMVVVAEAHGEPVCSSEELARMDAPLNVVRDDHAD